MSKFYYFILLVFICSYVSAQNSISLKGKVIDETTKSPIESATVYLSSIKDSTVIAYTITDKFGKFDFKTKKSNKPLHLKVSFVSYQDYKIELKSIEEGKDFGTIALKEAVKSLDEVVVRSQAPPIRIKKDTLEFNVSSFKVRPDANVETLLKQLPGVEIDSDGKITVNGKEVNQILVNGKPFFDKDGKIALQNLPSDIIKKVQITDTKTKKEENTGAVSSSNNASINLTIDEDKNKGFFGKFMGGAGSDSRYESSALVNYFKNKRKISVLASSNNINSTGFSMDEIFDNMGGGRNTNVWMNSNGTFGINGRQFGSGNGITRSDLVGINYSDEWRKDLDATLSYFYSAANTKNDNITNQVNFLPSGDFATRSNFSSNEDRYTHNIASVFEFKIDSTTSIILEPNFTKANSKKGIVSEQFSFDAQDALLNSSTSDNFYENDLNGFTNTLSFTKSFKKKGKFLSIVFRNDNSVNTNDDYIDSKTVFNQDGKPDDIRKQLNETKNIRDNYFTEIEFTQPVTDSLKVKLGVEYKFEQKKDNRDSFDYDENNKSYSVVNDELTNIFNSTENTFSPNTGIILNKKKVNLYLNLGTTIINFDNKGDYLNVVTSLNKEYVLPYTNAYASYAFSNNKNISVNYNYSYNLPTSKQVLPIEDLADPLNTFIGNPNLDLNKNHGIYLSYRNFDFATRSGYGLYSGGNFYDNQVVASVSYDDNRKRTTTYENVAGTYNSWLGFYWNKTIKNEAHTFKYGLRLNNNFNFSKGFTDDELYTAKSYVFSPRINFGYDYGEILSINPSYEYSYNKTSFTNYNVDQADYFTHKLNLQVTNYWPKNWTFGNDFGYTYNSNISPGFKKDFFLWNTSLAYSFFEKKFMAKVKVYDLLNQNQSATRMITPTTIVDEQNTVLKRYVMFSLTYKLEKFAGKEKKSNRMMF
ncbi:TonB-dependent receptor [Flavobacterium sp. 5]|uniref:TonB-dependent receptor n=1 Tax=Flavobacterium sp. 5 TaxID=2035199 RepID=UPI000C2C3FF5|nr:TonB-dependent receptor [Flavobacterium sp. 5]PKB15887.1 outer membrane receptor protein involved in Fe transport [Flavobacterium sp. 5]